MTEQEVNVTEQFTNIINNLNIFKTHIIGLQQNIKQVEKSVKKQLKDLKKTITKNKNKGNKQPSGFAKPCKVSKELCEFMNKSEGSEVARTEVTKYLIEYVKVNNLVNVNNKKIILPDIKLKSLLGIEDGHELTYFNIQKYMNKHFIHL